MQAAGFRRLALAMDGAIEGAHMGHPDFRVNNRIFATLRADQTSGMVQLTPDDQQRFVQEDPATFAPESGAWGRGGSTRVRLASADAETLGEAVTLAWQHAVAKGPTAPAKRLRAVRAGRPSRRRGR